jgi:hypothetical protein
MKSFLAALLAAVIIAIGAVHVLDAYWMQADQALTAGTSVRLPDHGDTHNLVGKDSYTPTKH